MAYNSHSSLLSLLLIFNLLLAITQVTIAGRNVPTISNNDEKKQPEWFIEPDGSVLIPGIGRVMVPYFGGYTPYSGGSGGTGSLGSGGDNGIGSGGGSLGNGGGDVGVGSGGGSLGNGGGNDGIGSGGANGGYIPGGDDTFVPNPGVEVPNPVGGGGIPAAIP